MKEVSFSYAILGGQLTVSLAYDSPHSLILVDANSSQGDLTLYEALEIAKENLRERTTQFVQIADRELP